MSVQSLGLFVEAEGFLFPNISLEGKMRVYVLRAVMTAMILGVMVILTACAGGVTEPTPPETSPVKVLELTDQLGRMVSVSGVPQRIISLTPSNTEILYALGLADRIVAVTDFCDYPAQAKEKPSIGGFSTPNIEEIIARNADLVLASSMHATEYIPEMERLGLTVLALDPGNLAEVLKSIDITGKATGAGQAADELIEQMRTSIKAVTDKTSALAENERPRVFYAVWHDPLMTAGGDTMIGELIEMAGGVNIADSLSLYATIQLEDVIVANPQVLIAGSSHGSGEERPYRFLLDTPNFSGTDVRQQGQVYQIDGNLVSRNGPRLVEGLQMFAAFIQPDLFGTED
ncbi:ABC transporter substrate-binding protein [Chloroflexota bacterium]